MTRSGVGLSRNGSRLAVVEGLPKEFAIDFGKRARHDARKVLVLR